MGNDGTIVIGTKLDTKQLEQQLKQQEKRLKDYEKEAEKLTTAKTKVDADLGAYEKEKQAIQERTDENLKYAQTEEQVKNVLGLEKTELDNLNAKYGEAFKKNEDINAQLQQNKKNQAIIRGLIGRTNDELGKTKGFDKIKDMFKDLGKETEKNIKKVGKYVLAIFGIRAVYSFIRNSINTITSNDEQLKADIDYMKTALAYVIEPVIRKIVEWAKILFQYVAYIIKSWTGQDIFASADKNLKKANKSAKELKKQLAGFDEANVLSDTSSKDAGGATPSVKALGEGEVPKWLKWIGDHAPEILSVLGGIITAITLIKLGIDALTATGIGTIIAGVLLTIISLLDYLKDPSIENFGKILIGIGITIAGIGVAIGAWPVVLAGAIVAVIGLITKHWNTIHKFLQDKIDWLTGQSDWIHEHFGDVIGGIYDFFVEHIQLIVNFLDENIKNCKMILDGIIEFISGVFTGDWDKAWDGLFKIATGMFNNLIAPFKFVFDTILSLGKTIIQAIVNIFSGGFDSIKRNLQGIANFFSVIIEGIWNGFKWMVNLVIGGLNILIKGMNKLQWDVPSWVPLIGGQKWGVNIPEIPKLARGGIVNMPGSGVMMGNYIAGEHGREAVLPLQDPTAMSMLGQEIARYVNISNAVEVNMDSRRISRIMQQSQINNDFARNV